MGMKYNGFVVLKKGKFKRWKRRLLERFKEMDARIDASIEEVRAQIVQEKSDIDAEFARLQAQIDTGGLSVPEIVAGVDSLRGSVAGMFTTPLVTGVGAGQRFDSDGNPIVARDIDGNPIPTRVLGNTPPADGEPTVPGTPAESFDFPGSQIR